MDDDGGRVARALEQSVEETRRYLRAEGAAAERASMVAWLRTGLIRVAGQNLNDAALFRLVAMMVERGDHAQPEPVRREDGIAR